MTAPTVQSTAEDATTTAGTSHVVTKPSGTTSGDLWLIVGATQVAATFDALAGWNELVDDSTSNVGTKALYRVCDGSEGSTVTFTSAASVKYAGVGYRITGFSAVQAPQVSTQTAATSTTPNPGTVTPTGGTKDYLFIAFFGQIGEEADDDTWVTGTPANYGNLSQKTSGTAGATTTNCQVGAAYRTASVSSEDPGTFTTAQSLAWRAYTVAVHPGVSIAVVQATETNTAFVVTPLRTRTIGQTTETDTANPVTRVVMATVNQSTESDLAQPIGRLKVRAVAQAFETDLSQSADPARVIPVGLASETDEAFALEAQGTTVVVGQVSEFDLAQPVTAHRTYLLGQSAEIDVAQMVVIPKLLVLEQAIETDEAQGVAGIVNPGHGIVRSPNRVRIYASHNEVT